jgi:tetratricopeptide (TPR) repeat protein
MIQKALLSPWIRVVGVVIIVFILYGKTLSFGYVLDDDLVFKNNQVELGISGIGDIISSGYLEGFNGQSFSYRPLTLITFAIERSLFSDSIPMSRLVHLLLYALCIIILYNLLKSWFQDFPDWIIGVIALLYLLHPIHTEVVCNLKSRDELLMCVFLLGSFQSMNIYLSSKKWGWMISSITLALLAMMSKESAVLYMAFIPTTLLTINKLSWKHSLGYSGLFLLPFAGYFLIRQMVLSGGSLPEEVFLYNNAFVGTDMLDRVANASYLFLFYIWKSFFPMLLTWDYSYSTLTLIELGSAIGIVSILSVVGIISTALFYLKREAKYFWLLIGFSLPLLTILNLFILIGANFAERFLFIPSLFAMLFLVWMIEKLPAVSGLKTKHTSYIFLGIAVLYAFQTFQRVPYWESNETLFLASLETNPESARVQTSLGTEYRSNAEKIQPSPRQEALYKKAIFHYDKAIDILPKAFDAIYNKAIIYQATGRVDLAKTLFNQVLTIDSNYVAALTNLGVIHFNDKDIDQADIYFKKAYSIQATDPDAVSNMGVIAHTKGDYETALEFYRQSLRIRPNQPTVIRNMEMVKVKLNE